MNSVYIATSLDGFIARVDGTLDWLEILDEPEDDHGFADFLDRIDALVMGRKTYETVLGFENWPYTKPVFVLSSTLKEIPAPLQVKVEVVNDEPEKIVEYLKSRDFNDLYIDGGMTIQSFLREDLIDEMIITTVPIILGKGIPLFNQLDGDIKFKCKSVELINQQMVKHHYVRDE